MSKFAIFEKYSHTSEKTKKVKLHPLKIRLSIGRTFQIITDYFQSTNPADIVIASEYYDVCILDEKGFEISVQLLSGEGSTFINVSVYGDKLRGKTRGRLYQVLNEFKLLFKDYI